MQVSTAKCANSWFCRLLSTAVQLRLCACFLAAATPVCTAFPDLCWICCTCVCLSIFAKANPLECHLPLSPGCCSSWFCLLSLVGAASAAPASVPFLVPPSQTQTDPERHLNNPLLLQFLVLSVVPSPGCCTCCTCFCPTPDVPHTQAQAPSECHLSLSPCCRRSWFCLLFLVLGAAGYVMVDSGFEIRAYFWLLMWYFFFVFDAVSQQT